MARPGISQEEIIAAIEQVVAQGEKLNVNRVREALGNRGTPAIIARIIKERYPEAAATSGEGIDMQQQQTFNMELELSKNTMTEAPADSPVNPEAPSANPNEMMAAAPTVAPASGNEPPSVSPVAETANPEAPAAPVENGDRRERLGFRKRQHDNQRPPRDGEQSRSQQQNNQDQGNASQQNNVQPEVYYTENLENMSEKDLAIKIRRLEIYLNKEQSRREAAEKMAREAKEYAEAIKEQIGQRIADLREALEETIDQLKAEARDLKANAENDLKFYREQLEKANRKIISLINGDPENKA